MGRKREGMIESENLIMSNDINVKMSENLNRRRGGCHLNVHGKRNLCGEILGNRGKVY